LQCIIIKGMSSVKITLLTSAAFAVFLAGCASQSNVGSAATSVSGTGQSKGKERKQGEFYNTETLAPGVGSALFPDPSW